MFPRISIVKKGNRTYEYLKLVENKWQKGKVVQRVIANFGNIVPFKAKLPKLLKALRKYSDEKRFQIEKVIFILDRDMISNENIKYLEQKGYGYIISLNRRKCQEMKYALNKLDGKSVKINDGLKSCEIKQGTKRIILCYNRERAEIEKSKRRQIMDELKIRLEKLREAVLSGRIKSERGIIKMAEKILMRKHGCRYFDYEIKGNKFNYWENKEKIEYEEKIDGKYLLETNIKELTLTEVVLAYKELSKVEVAFREIKDFIKLRPIFHSDTERIKSHVFICIWTVEKIIIIKNLALSYRRVFCDINLCHRTLHNDLANFQQSMY